MKNKNMNNIINHLKKFGFVYQSSKIYGGLANTWDYGHLGILLIKNIKNLWWKEFITKSNNVIGLESKIILNNKVWEASGHISNFLDSLIENKVNGKRYRVDHIIKKINPSINIEKLSNLEIETWIKKNVKKWENEKTNWGKIKKFNLMFETYQGPVVDLKSKVYLRPEIAQGIFINFMNIQRTSRLKIPFGVGQIGKSFRNEVTPRNFIFRTREFEQMELEYFVKPGEDEKIYNEYINKVENFLKILGLKNTTRKKHNNKELAHYAKATTDIEYDFPFGKGELLGISNRTDYDLKNHAKHSGKKIEYKDPNTNEKYIPYVIEPSIGVDRLMLALLIDAYKIEELKNDKRIILKLDKKIAPYKIAVVPLNKKNHSKFAKKILNILLNKNISTTYDENGSIGRRYRRQDAIGTPYVITIIDKTKKEKKVTIRHRDTMKQEEIFLDEIDKYL